MPDESQECEVCGQRFPPSYLTETDVGTAEVPEAVTHCRPNLSPDCAVRNLPRFGGQLGVLSQENETETK